MKKLLLMIIMVSTCGITSSFAQETILSEINYNDLEKYIQMAKDYYPQRQIVREQGKIAKNNHTMSQISYLDIFSANYYYRPDEREALNSLNPYVTNGFQASVGINLGNYLQKPFQTKSAKSSLKIAQLEMEIMDTELEKEVKNRYYNYIQQVKELMLKTKDAQDINGTLQSITNRFEKGEITIEEYNTARSAVSAVSSTKMQTELNYLRAKDDLEEVIGAKLADIK